MLSTSLAAASQLTISSSAPPPPLSSSHSATLPPLHNETILGGAHWSENSPFFVTSDAAGVVVVWKSNPVCSEVACVWSTSSSSSAAADGSGAAVGPAAMAVTMLPHHATPLVAVAQGDGHVSVFDATVGTTVCSSGGGSGFQRRRRSSVQWPVLNAVTSLPFGPQLFCYGGDSGDLLVYDTRAESSKRDAGGEDGMTGGQQRVRLHTPITALCAADSSSSVVMVGDACGAVRWVDLRGGRGSSHNEEVFLMRGVVTDLIPGSNLYGGEEELVGLVSGDAASSCSSPQAVWLDTKPFSVRSLDRVLGRVLLHEDSEELEIRNEEEEGGGSVLHFWRGDRHAPSGRLLLPTAKGAQLRSASSTQPVVLKQIVSNPLQQPGPSQRQDRRTCLLVGGSNDDMIAVCAAGKTLMQFTL